MEPPYGNYPAVFTIPIHWITII